MTSTEKVKVDVTKQTINVLTVLLYNSRLCSSSCVLNLINFINFFVTIIALYLYYISTIPSFREKHINKFVISEYLLTTYYLLEICIRYVLYTFHDITTYNRIDEFYSAKESILYLSDRQYRVITVGDLRNEKEYTKDRKKKKKTFTHLIRFFLNKMEIICLLSKY